MIGKKCGFVLLVFGILSIVLGVVIKFMVPAMIDSELKAKLPLVKGSETWETWKNPGKLGVYMQFYFFNIKNHLDANASGGITPLERGGIPDVEQKGPYIYRETRERTILGFNEEKTELTFSEKTKFEFDAARSNGSENDTIHSINLPLMTVYNTLGGLAPDKELLGKLMFNNAAKSLKWTVVESKSVKDWLWGVDSDILAFALGLPENVVPADMKAKIPSKKFGFMMDNTGSSRYELGTGYKDLNDIGQIKKYNNMTKLDYWGSDYANTIKGTDGSVFHPNIDSNETLYMFTTDLCRSIYATNTGKQMVKGIETYLFSPPPDVFADAKDNPDNEGFCEPKPCLGTGLLRVSTCHHDAPLVITQPHLCDAAQDIQEKIKGLNPDPQKHNTQLYIEPNLGALVEAHKRLQFNALLLPEKGMELTGKLTKNQIVPLFWVEEGFTADEEYAGMLRSKLLLLNLGEIVFYATICLGVMLVIVAFFAFACHEKTGRGEMNLVPPVRMTSVAKNSESDGYKNHGYSRQH